MPKLIPKLELFFVAAIALAVFCGMGRIVVHLGTKESEAENKLSLAIPVLPKNVKGVLCDIPMDVCTLFLTTPDDYRGEFMVSGDSWADQNRPTFVESKLELRVAITQPPEFHAWRFNRTKALSSSDTLSEAEFEMATARLKAALDKLPLIVSKNLLFSEPAK